MSTALLSKSCISGVSCSRPSSARPSAAPARPCPSAAPRHSRSTIRRQAGASSGSRLHASSNGATATADRKGTDVPIVRIDNTSDPFATMVTVEFGDRLGELLDTITSLKNLGLNIRRATLPMDGSGRKPNTFYITETSTSEKVLKSARLEEIRMTIINNLLTFHPESSEALAAGKSRVVERDSTSPLGLRNRSMVQTTIEVSEVSSGSCSLLKISTRDRPGLLVDVVGVLKDLNVNVVSAEIDTIGDEARDDLFVTYHGEPLNGPMCLLVQNALQYYLSLAEVSREESY